MKKSNIVVIVFFLAMIIVLSVCDIVTPDRARSETEKRELAQMPELSLKTVFDGTFTGDYEEYVTDQFIMRDAWVSLAVRTQRLFGRNDINNIYLARDGYYIDRLAANEADTDRIGENIGHIKTFLEKLPDSLKDSTAVAIVPTAALILEDKLPALNDEFDWDNMLDQVADGIGEYSLDLRPVLREHASEEIYYRTDHHWTSDGAYLGYTEIAAKLGFEPLDKDEFEKKELTENFLGTTISKLNIKTDEETIISYEPKDQSGVKAFFEKDMGKPRDSYNDVSKLETNDEYAYFLGGDQGFVEINTGTDSDRVLMVVKDSYANCMIPMLSAHYGKIYVADPRGCRSILTRLNSVCKDTTDVLVLFNADTFTEHRDLVWIHK